MSEKSKSNASALFLLMLSMFIVMVGFGIIMPILPYYAENMGASATQLGFLFAMYALLQFIFAPIWGRLSDRIGRKPVLLIGIFGFAFTFFGFGLSTELWMLFASRSLSGLLSSAALPTMMAYIADTTESDARADGMGKLGAAMGLGMIFGPVIGGFLGEFNPSIPFFVASGLALVVAVIMTFLIPETLSVEMRKSAKQQKQGSSILNVFKMLASPLGFILLLAFLTSFGMAQMEGISALFYERRFGAGEAEMGFLFMVMGITTSISQGVFVGRVINFLGEERAIQIGVASIGITYAMFIFVHNFTSALIVVAIMGVVSSLLRPAINSLISKRTDQSEQGQTLGVVNSYYSLGRVFGPIVGGYILDNLGLDWPYLSAAVIHLIAFILSYLYLSRRVNSRAVQRSAAK